MKALLVSIAYAVSSLLAGAQVGRYQLVTGNISYGGTIDGKEKVESVIMRIDTVTGQVWRYSRMDFPVKEYPGDIRTMFTEGWVTTMEDYFGAIEHHRRAADALAKRPVREETEKERQRRERAYDPPSPEKRPSLTLEPVVQPTNSPSGKVEGPKIK